MCVLCGHHFTNLTVQQDRGLAYRCGVSHGHLVLNSQALSCNDKDQHT